MDRKSFIQKSAGALIILPAVGLVGCSSSDDGGNDPDPNPNPQANCLDNGTAVSIGANHGHTLMVSKSDVQSGTEKTYSIQGSSEHDHTVTLQASHFNSLKSNSSITITSTSGGGHTHSVTVSCA